MAYFHPGKGMEQDESEYNLAIYHLVEQWIKLQTKSEARQLRKLELYGVLRTLFGVWERCVIQLEAEGLWGEKERRLRDDVRQRVRLLQIAETDPVVKDQELKAWNEMWAIKRREEKRAAKRAKRRIQRKRDKEEASKATSQGTEVKGDGKESEQDAGSMSGETVAPTELEERTHRKVDIS
jgi:hypothetical protein